MCREVFGRVEVSGGRGGCGGGVGMGEWGWMSGRGWRQ